jgi:PAS domain S-box-containing protein
MQKSLFEELQRQAVLAKQSHTVEEGMQHLASAFALFSEESKRLSLLHHSMQKQVQSSKQHLVEKISQLNMISEFLHNILASLSQGILFINMDGVILSMNPAAEKMLQMKADHLLYQKFSNHFKDGFFGFSMKDALSFGVTHSLYHISLPHKEDRTKELEVTTSFVFSGHKDYHGLILGLRDITKMQKLQETLGRNERMTQLGEMLATITHEIKNPLGGIKGYASLLARELEDQSHQEKAVHILEGVKTLESIVGKVLTYARPIEVHPTSTDLALFLRKFLKWLKVDPSFPKNIQMELHISEEPFFAPVDPTAFRSAVHNIIINAYQAMTEGGRLIITLMKQNETAQLTIADTGCGIDEADQERIFTPFFTTKKTGNGLGLAETHRIIHAHYGHIHVRSQKGNGTTFTIGLPLKR